MKRSEHRILTTHVGSLPRPVDLVELIRAKEDGNPYNETQFANRLRAAVSGIVSKQHELGIDIVDDGEFSKLSFMTYVNDRLTGFEVDTAHSGQGSWAGSREEKSFPEFYKPVGAAPKRQPHLVCRAPIKYRGHQDLTRDLDNLKAAAAKADVAEVFVPAISPSNVEFWHRNEYYKNSEDFVAAIGEAMREEYLAIVNAGFLLQIDDPRLVCYYVLHPEMTVAQFRKWAETQVEILNHALRGIPEDRIRHHTCYGINIGPRIHDLELKHAVDLILKIKAGAYSFEAANPRHDHEWELWNTVKLPAGKILIPGVISNSTVLVEHPELVAQRIVRYAQAVGKENVIAGSDCGFATNAGSTEIQEDIVWAKFQAMRAGADIASKALWKK